MVLFLYLNSRAQRLSAAVVRGFDGIKVIVGSLHRLL